MENAEAITQDREAAVDILAAECLVTIDGTCVDVICPGLGSRVDKGETSLRHLAKWGSQKFCDKSEQENTDQMEIVVAIGGGDKAAGQ